MNKRNQRDQDRVVRLLLLTGLLAALALRVYRLGLDSLWYDETVSAYLSSRQPLEIIRHTAGDIHPPGYYLMLYGWRGMVHPTLNTGLEYLLGWSSVVWGMLVVALLYPLGRKLLDRRSALLAVWLAAINPFHIWYSQEVRMYTMGAALGLLCLWAALKWRDSASRPWLFLLAYVVCATIGLYTLYFFSFLLVAINVIVLMLIWLDLGSPNGSSRRSIIAWLSAQVVALLLFSPWLPTLWRQATNPPVPPWRIPWQNLAEFGDTVSESLTALLVGQSPPGQIFWPWPLLTILATAIFVIWPIPESASHDPTTQRQTYRGRQFAARLVLLTYIFLPIAILYTVTLIATPVYHVRYLFMYVPPFMLIVAASLSALWTKQQWLGIGSLVLVVGVSFAGLQQTWFSPLYRSDDHRKAVAELAENWRPGDLILVNAGWAYTALDTYWPQELDGPGGSMPPRLATSRRFNEMPRPPILNQPIVAVTGSVDGEESLGWGDPESDFFSITQGETIAALDELAQDYRRIWQYRIYDTVSDPESLIRNRLAENGDMLWEAAYTGRDFLRVQMFANHTNMSPSIDEGSPDSMTTFGESLGLTKVISPANANAGEMLYVELTWLPLSPISTLESGLAMSLRLYDSGGNLVAQDDSPPLPPTETWQTGETRRQPLALAIPIATKPGAYSLELVVYRQDDGIPLALEDSPRSVHGQRLQLDTINILPGQVVPPEPVSLARFDYIDLVEANATPHNLAPGADLRLALIWQPRPSSYRDNYVATVALLNENGDSVASWTEPLGGSDYLSAQWPAKYPVMETRQLMVPESIASGDYTLILSVERSSDGLLIKARQARLPFDDDYVSVAELTIE